MLDPREERPMLTRTQNQRGFSLMEMLIGIAIIALLLKIAAPSYRTWMQNTQIRSAAHAISDGINSARGMAISRNVAVQIQLTSQGSGSNPAWQVALVSAPTVPIQSWSSAEGASSAQILQAGGGILTFNALGRVVSPNPIDSSLPLLQVDVTSNNDGGDLALRNMRVVVGNGGMARMCDPNLAQPDPRAC